jgi:hypothetical protein
MSFTSPYSVGELTFTGGGLSLAPSLPLMMMGWVNNDHDLRFYGIENGAKIEATFKPEADITTIEFMRVQLMADMIMISAAANSQLGQASVKPIEYLRTHNLVRHFVFKVIP